MLIGAWLHRTQFWKRTSHLIFYQSLVPIEQLVPDKKIFLTLTNQKQELPLVAIFVGGMGRNEETL